MVLLGLGVGGAAVFLAKGFLASLFSSCGGDTVLSASLQGPLSDLGLLLSPFSFASGKVVKLSQLSSARLSVRYMSFPSVDCLASSRENHDPDADLAFLALFRLEELLKGLRFSGELLKGLDFSGVSAAAASGDFRIEVFFALKYLLT